MNLRKFSLLGCLILCCSTVIAEKPVSTPGISKTKPDSGYSVAIDGGFMVPYTVTIPGTDIEFEMIPVPGGSYMMGSPESEEGRKEDEGPQIKVEVDPMWVCKTEVRWIEYKEFMNMYTVFKEFQSQGIRKVTDDNKVDAVTTPTELYDPSFTFEFGEDDDQPAVTMTQYSAKQYTKWLSKMLGQQYRIPTEAEWEWACRGGSNTKYSWGDSTDDIGDYAWYIENSDEGPQKVATKKPNSYGLYDMHGNVAEWTMDGYLEDGYAVFEGKTIKAVDAIKTVETPDQRVVRGGSWEMDAEDIRSASRLFSIDEDWKMEDPNIPLSPWWFTSDPARGVGMRLFRSLETMADKKITKFWELDSEDVDFDVQSRIDEGRGVLGLVDPELPTAKKALDN